MKKLSFALPIVVLLAAGCNSPQQAINQTPVQTQVAQNATPTSTNPAQTSTSGQTAGWQTYTNSSFGYNIQYPSNWSIDNQRSSANELVFNNGSPESHISISVQPYSKTITDWEKGLDQTVITKTKTFSIDGQSGIEFYSGEMGGLAGQAGVVYNGQLYIFDEVDSMPAGMLSSFKFNPITIQNQNSNWQTCQSAKYNYSLKYPAGWSVGVPGDGEMSIVTCDNKDIGNAIFSAKPYGDGAADIFINFSVTTADEITKQYGSEAKSLVDYVSKTGDTSLTPDHQWLQETQIDGEQAFWYKDMVPGNTLDGYQIRVVTVHQGSAYQFSLQNLTANDPIVIQFFNNFKFLK